MNKPLTLTKEQRIKLIKLIHLLDAWEFKQWDSFHGKTLLWIVNMKTKEEMIFHWYELLTTYLLVDLCEKYRSIRSLNGIVKFVELSNKIIDVRLYFNESQHPVDTIYEHFEKFIK